MITEAQDRTSISPPERLEVIESDTTGNYVYPWDCTIARALKRIGFTHFSVGGFGRVYLESPMNPLGYYEWSDGQEFERCTSKRTGTLVFVPLKGGTREE